jgi:hypothetical protein
VSKNRLICEGWLEEGTASDGENLVFPVATAYVRQADTVWFAQGRSTDMYESLDEGVTVLESYSDLDLVERTLPGGQTTLLPENATWTVEGIYQLSDVENANKRVYGRKIWEKLIADQKSAVQKTIQERGMVGHLEHPSDGRTDGKEVALLVTEATLRDDGVVWGKSELLNTPNGLILQEMTRAGVRWGVSSRGNGSVGNNGQVNEDFELTTWDAVMRPSTPGAYPKPLGTPQEHKESEAVKAEAVVAGTPQPIKPLVELDVFDTNAARGLLETDIDTLDSVERTTLFRRLIGEQQKVIDHLAVGSLKATEAQELHKWFNQKLFAIHETGFISLDDTLSEALENVSDESSGDYNYGRVIESLRTQVSDSVTEAIDLQERLEATESLTVRLRDERDFARRTAEQISSTLGEQCSIVERRLEGVTHKLELANDLLSEQSQSEAVFDAVQDAIRLQPELGNHREVLLCAKDGGTVMRLAEAVISGKATLVEEVVETEEAEPARHTLPRGSVASGVINTRSLPSMSELPMGARLAAQMMGKTT